MVSVHKKDRYAHYAQDPVITSERFECVSVLSFEPGPISVYVAAISVSASHDRSCIGDINSYNISEVR